MIKSILVENFKGIKSAKLDINSRITGIYGENGVGKTTIIEAIQLFREDYCNPTTNEKTKLFDLLKKGETSFSYCVEFEVESLALTFYRKFDYEAENFKGYEEEIKYKYINKKGDRFKRLYSKKDEDTIGSKLTYKVLNKTVKEDIDELSTENFENLTSNKSAFFNIITKPSIEELIDEEVISAVKQIEHYIGNAQFIDLASQAASTLGVVIPLHHHYESELITSHGTIPIVQYDMYYSEEEYNIISNILVDVSRMLQVVADGKKVYVERYKDRLNDDNELEIAIIVYVEDKEKRITIENESTGIVKLISMLSSISSLMISEEALVLIDELDAHVFEYLLSVLITSLNDHIRGTLIFTSHNLTLFESLSKDSIVVASRNEKNCVELNQFKHVYPTTNIRDLYIRLQNYDENQDIHKAKINKSEIEYLFEDIELGL